MDIIEQKLRLLNLRLASTIARRNTVRDSPLPTNLTKPYRKEIKKYKHQTVQSLNIQIRQMKHQRREYKRELQHQHSAGDDDSI